MHRLTAIIEREDSGYVSLCPELDIASQGETIEQALENLKEALELIFETAGPFSSAIILVRRPNNVVLAVYHRTPSEFSALDLLASPYP